MVVKQAAWPSATELRANAGRLRQELVGVLREYELRYELRSGRVEQELAAGRLRETAEIARWLIAYETYQALSDERLA